MNDPKDKQRESNLKTLRPRKHEIDFFFADEVELSSFRDDIASMEHPFFALKGGDTTPREYKNGDVIVTVKSTSDGLATIFDKDIWIYAISKLQESINKGEPISKYIKFTPYDFFVTTNRSKSGRSYEELKKTLSRLKGTVIETNVNTDNKELKARSFKNFGLIESSEINEVEKGGRTVSIITIELPTWLIQALENKRVVKLNPNYFCIRKAIDRRIYEIARKHCGNQGQFQITLEKLHLKTGSSASKSEFKRMFKTLVASNDLPDYSIVYDLERDMVIFSNKNLTQEQEKKEQQREQGKREVFKSKKMISDSKASHKSRKYVVDICNPGEPDSEIPPGFRG